MVKLEKPIVPIVAAFVDVRFYVVFKTWGACATSNMIETIIAYQYLAPAKAKLYNHRKDHTIFLNMKKRLRHW